MVKTLITMVMALLACPVVSVQGYEIIDGQAQGTTYHISYQPAGITIAKPQIDSILKVIDHSLSLWEPSSLINTFNKASRNVRMDEHMSRVVRRAQEISKASHGSFDITVKPFMDAWGFGVKAGDKPVPTTMELSLVAGCVGTEKLHVKGTVLRKSSPCTQIDANGIAQGYSVDVIADWLESKGVTDYLVELGGEIRVRGVNPKGKPWTIGVEAAATDKEDEPGMSATLQPGSGGITTAGNYRKYIESGGKRFSHIMDPRTGMPVSNGIVSVTVRAATAMDADAWDDALFVLGVDSSFDLLARHPEIQARFLLATADGRTKDTATAGFFESWRRGREQR